MVRKLNITYGGVGLTSRHLGNETTAVMSMRKHLGPMATGHYRGREHGHFGERVDELTWTIDYNRTDVPERRTRVARPHSCVSLLGIKGGATVDNSSHVAHEGIDLARKGELVDGG